MTTTMHTDTNGRSRKSLAEQIDRLDHILDGLGEGLNEAVATVDGLDVISGRTGSFENRGYVLLPWSSVEIDGFRQSRDEV